MNAERIGRRREKQPQGLDSISLSLSLPLDPALGSHTPSLAGTHRGTDQTLFLSFSSSNIRMHFDSHRSGRERECGDGGGGGGIARAAAGGEFTVKG